MQFETYTINAQEALREAQQLASASRHAEVTPLHLLLALTRQEEGIVVPLLQRLGADPRAPRSGSLRWRGFRATQS